MTRLAGHLCTRPTEVSGVPVEACQPCVGVCLGLGLLRRLSLLSSLHLLGGRAAAGKCLPLGAPEHPSHVGE